MGKGLVPADDPNALGIGGPAVGRLLDGRLRRGRRGARHRLRPRGALARALEPRPRQADRLHRLGRRRRSTSTSSPRSSWWATSTTCSPGSPRSAATCRTSGGSTRLREVVLGPLRGRARTTTHFPVQPPRALWEIRKALGREDILISDVGLHKLWIGRMFPAYEPNTVLIANGLAGMGFALPAAIAAKLVHPDRKVVTVNGDGGFLMNCQELETAVRLQTPFVNVIWENQPVRLDRLEAGQEVRRALRRGLHQPGLREAGRELRHARLALRVGRRLRPAAAPRARARRALADGAADRLLDRRGDQRGAGYGDACAT